MKFKRPIVQNKQRSPAILVMLNIKSRANSEAVVKTESKTKQMIEQPKAFDHKDRSGGDGNCCVCNLPKEESENRLVNCSTCGVHVHQGEKCVSLCRVFFFVFLLVRGPVRFVLTVLPFSVLRRADYFRNSCKMVRVCVKSLFFLLLVPNHAWFRRCQICLSGAERKCALCPVSSGAFKRVAGSDQWVHIVSCFAALGCSRFVYQACVLYQPDGAFDDAFAMNSAHLDSIPREAFKHECAICHSTMGATINCHVRLSCDLLMGV